MNKENELLHLSGELTKKFKKRLENTENLTAAEKGILVGAYQLGIVDTFLHYTTYILGIKAETKEIIQDAISYFADTCPHCERALEIDIDDATLDAWLEKEGKNGGQMKEAKNFSFGYVDK